MAVGRQATALVVSCDSLKPALVHEADYCLGRHSSFGSSDHDRPPREKWHKREDKILLFFYCQKL